MTSKNFVDSSPFSTEKSKQYLTHAQRSLAYLLKLKEQGRNIPDIDLHITQFEHQVKLYTGIINGTCHFVPDEKH